MQETSVSELLAMTADIVSAFVSNNTVRAAELPDLISTVHVSLQKVTQPPAIEEAAVDLKPAVSVKKSVTDDYLICLDDGKKFKSLRRHLATLGMTPDEYRAKWGLPRDYPMVAPGYAAKRSELAKISGLGSNRRKTAGAPADGPGQAPANDATAPRKRKAAAKRTDSAEAVVAAPLGDVVPRRRGRPSKKAA